MEIFKNKISLTTLVVLVGLNLLSDAWRMLDVLVIHSQSYQLSLSSYLHQFLLQSWVFERYLYVGISALLVGWVIYRISIKETREFKIKEGVIIGFILLLVVVYGLNYSQIFMQIDFLGFAYCGGKRCDDVDGLIHIITMPLSLIVICLYITNCRVATKMV